MLEYNIYVIRCDKAKSKIISYYQIVNMVIFMIMQIATIYLSSCSKFENIDISQNSYIINLMNE